MNARSIMVTGAGTGIGRATALAFAAQGDKLTIADIDEAAIETVEKIKALGGTAQFLRCDVSDPQAVRAVVDAAIELYGGLHAAFNNAGILPPTEPLHTVEDETFARILDVDVKGVFYCMRAQIDHFLTAGGGVIVNTASIAGLVADPGMSAYVAAKHAVIGLTRAAAVEYAAKGIRVNAIAPGLVNTPMTRHWLENEAYRKVILPHTQIGRAAEPEEIAGTVLHLCSDAASFTNGAVHVLDGGQIVH